MKKKFIALALILLGVAWFFLKSNKGDLIVVNGEKFTCYVYDASKELVKVNYVRSDVSVFQKNKWLLPAVVTSGVDVVGKLNDADIESAFERPSSKIVKAVKENIVAIGNQMKEPKGGYEKNAELLLKSLVLIEINGEQYLVVCFSTNLLRNSTSQMTLGLVKVGKNWKYMSQDRESKMASIKKLNAISQAALKLVSEGKIKMRNLDELK